MKICLRLILAAAILIVLPAASDAQDRKAERLARREARRIENAIRDSLRKVMADEELIDLMKAILGLGPVISNVNLPNRGQMSQIPNGAVVETNCVFDADSVRPISANPLPGEVAALVRRNSDNFDNLYAAIHERDLRRVFEVFMNQPLCSTLSVSDGKQLFREMCSSTEKYLKDFYGLRI